jgi:hypothetical protein
MISSLKFRRYIARVTLPFLTIWLCIFPSKSYAIFPAISLLPLAVEFVAANDAVFVLSNTSALVNLVGATFSYFAFRKVQEASVVKIPLLVNSILQPFASPVISYGDKYKIKLTTLVSYDESTGNAVATQQTFYGVNFQDICSSVSGYLDQFGSTCGYQYPSNVPIDVQAGGFVRANFNASLIIKIDPCPSGYVSNSGSGTVDCNLISGDLAVQDGVYNFARSNSGFTQNVNDADLIGLNKLNFFPDPITDAFVPLPAFNSPEVLHTPIDKNLTINSLLSSMFISSGGNGVQVFGVDAENKPVVYQLNKRVDNGSDLYILKPAILTDGTAGTNYTKLSIAPNGLVDSVTNVQTAEKLQIAPAPSPHPNPNPYKDPAFDPLPVIDYPYLVPPGQTAPVYDPLSGVKPQLTPVGNPVPYTSPNGSPSGATFPSDYARQGEAKNAADSLAPKIDRIGDALVTPASATPDPTAVDETTMPTFNTTFDNLKGWRLPPHGSVCPTPQMTLFGNNYTLSSHCDLLDNYGSPLNQAMVVVFSVLALFIVLRA